MLLDQPISAHDVGLKLHCPRFDRDTPEFFIFEAEKNPAHKGCPEYEEVNSSSWVNLITQVERTVIQVRSFFASSGKELTLLRCTLGTRIISMEHSISDGA